MTFWILVAGLVAGVTLAITRPLMRSATPTGRTLGAADADLAVYKDQLSEVAADEARGMLAPSEAESARAEIARRLLRVKGPASAPPSRSSGQSRLARPISALISVALPIVSLAFYLSYGAPGLPGRPLSERLAETTGAANANDLVAKVEARLRDHPDDGMGWDVIAPVYFAMGRYGDAAQAYANAVRLKGESAARLQGFANARIRSENGIVPEDARTALERILVLAPDAKEPRIWLALAKEQDGRLAEAAADYRKLIEEAPADAPWRQALEERLANLEPKAENPPQGNGASRPTSPAAPDAAAVSAMTPEERQAFIAQMVDGLAERLKADGRDASGWARLIRAYVVLGRRDDALNALSHARAGLKDDEAGLAQVEDLARQLGLGS
jgi:cytochrome c-type biogenesis protein CcmH